MLNEPLAKWYSYKPSHKPPACSLVGKLKKIKNMYLFLSYKVGLSDIYFYQVTLHRVMHKKGTQMRNFCLIIIEVAIIEQLISKKC